MIDYVAIGRRVKKYRTQAKMTQSDLAEHLSVSVGYVSQIERGNTEVSLKRLADIANITNTKLAYLVAEPAINPNSPKGNLEELTEFWSEKQINVLLNIINNLNEYFES